LTEEGVAIAALDRGEADIALRMDRPRDKGAMAKRIGTMHFGLYANADYAARPPEKWEFIAFDEPLDHVPQQAWLRQFLAGRVVAFEASDLFGQLAAAKASAGIAVLPTIMGDHEPSLRRLDIKESPLTGICGSSPTPTCIDRRQ
jgi:DNA-binding transcriptional LysR family regulator